MRYPTADFIFGLTASARLTLHDTTLLNPLVRTHLRQTAVENAMKTTPCSNELDAVAMNTN